METANEEDESNSTATTNSSPDLKKIQHSQPGRAANGRGMNQRHEKESCKTRPAGERYESPTYESED